MPTVVLLSNRPIVDNTSVNPAQGHTEFVLLIEPSYCRPDVASNIRTHIVLSGRAVLLSNLRLVNNTTRRTVVNSYA